MWSPLDSDRCLLEQKFGELLEGLFWGLVLHPISSQQQVAKPESNRLKEKNENREVCLPFKATDLLSLKRLIFRLNQFYNNPKKDFFLQRNPPLCSYFFLGCFTIIYASCTLGCFRGPYTTFIYFASHHTTRATIAVSTVDMTEQILPFYFVSFYFPISFS